jgi:hypothetical protein
VIRDLFWRSGVATRGELAPLLACRRQDRRRRARIAVAPAAMSRNHAHSGEREPRCGLALQEPLLELSPPPAVLHSPLPLHTAPDAQSATELHDVRQ